MYESLELFKKKFSSLTVGCIMVWNTDLICFNSFRGSTWRATWASKTTDAPTVDTELPQWLTSTGTRKLAHLPASITTRPIPHPWAVLGNNNIQNFILIPTYKLDPSRNWEFFYFLLSYKSIAMKRHCMTVWMKAKLLIYKTFLEMVIIF